MQNSSLRSLRRLLAAEEESTRTHKNSRAGRRLDRDRFALHEHVHLVLASGDLSLIIATERAFLEGDLKRYANSPSMVSSLNAALGQIATIERHIDIVGDKKKYEIVDQAHSLKTNRKKGLPYDEARQALSSHLSRLANLDKSRLTDEEKKVIDVRRSAISAATKLYTARQAEALGVDFEKRKSQL